jgi:IS30 family transposase
MMKGDNDPDRRHRRDRVVELTRKGFMVTEISALLGVAERTVTRDRVARGCAEPRWIAVTGRELLRAKEMLDDGASYSEVGRTLGRAPQSISRHLPGYQWTREQAVQAATLGRRMSKLMREIA